MISGAKYTAVPTMECVTPFSGIALANPKSVIHIWPAWSIKMFSGFRSLYAYPYSCKCASASATYAA